MLLSFILVAFAISFQIYLKGSDTNDVHDRWPPLTAVDEYESCLRSRGDTYCFISARIHGDASNPIYSTLVEHSANHLTHYDRTNLHRGICIKKTCNDFVEVSPNVTIALEACLNGTLNQEYNITSKVFRVFCEEYKERIQFDKSDYAFGVVLLGLLGLNLLGILYDYCGGDGDRIVGKLLLCFSPRRNWWRLIAPASTEPGKSRLDSFSFYRAVFAVGCVFVHAAVSSTYAVKNPDFMEWTYNSVYLPLYTSVETLQLFFVISGILLVYKVLSSREQVSWGNLHKALLWRWLRFTPTYALLLFFNATWTRYIWNGPLWNATVGREISDCRRDWWLHLLYIHNYIDNSRCMIHSWTMAVDMQITALGLAIFLALKSNKARRAAIALVLVLGVITPAAATYFKNLHPIFVISPEVVLDWVAHNPTFNNLYKRGHTNIIGYALGWAMGYVVYNLKDSDVGAEKYKKYGLLLWLLYPLTLAIGMIGGVFYNHTVVVPLLARAIYAGVIKLVTGMLLSLHIFITIVQANNLQTRICSWQGWTILARLSFNVYLIHMCMLRIRAGSVKNLIQVSEYTMFMNFLETTITSLLLAVPLYVLVEAPCAQLTQLGLTRAQKNHPD